MLTIARWRLLASAIILLTALLTATFFHWGQAANLKAHDFLIEYGIITAVPEDLPLLVSVEAEDVNRLTLMPVFQNLESLGAEQLVVLPELSQQMASKDILPLLDSTAFSELLLLTTSEGASQSTTSPELSSSTSIDTATLPPPFFSNGYYRYIPRLSDDASHPLATKIRSGDNRNPKAINFLYQANGQPEVSAKQVATGQLIRDLVAGTSVLIELASAGSDPGYMVPGRSDAIDSLHIQGLIWTSLANDAAIDPYPVSAALLLVTLVFLVNLVILQWLPPLQSTLLSAVVAFLLIAAFTLTLRYGYQLLPLTELLTTQLVSLAFVFQAQRFNEARAVASMLADTNSLLSERLAPASFLQSDNPWAKIVVLINQQLNLSRSILLEKVPQDHRVQEIQALNCSIESIGERRRDYQRTPYSSAIEFGGPYRMDRSYFKETLDGELEYLVPLQFANEVMGFWALTVSPQPNWNETAFEGNVSDFAAQIAELLFHRNQWQKQRKLQVNMGARLMALEGGQRRYRELQTSLQLLEKRLDEMDDVFAGLGSAALLYDLFGQIKQTNQRLEQLAQESGFTPYSLTAAEFLCEVCDLDLDEARKELRHVTLKQEPVSLPVKPISQQRSYMLNVRPIRRTSVAADNTRLRGEIDPFQLVGILFEFVDISHTEALLAIRDDAFSRFSSDIRSPLNHITLAANRLKKLNTSPEATTKISTIDNSVSQVVRMVDGISQINVSGSDSYRRRSLALINPIRLVKQALTLVTESAQQKRLTLVEDWPYQVALALADNERLRQLITEVLTFLVHDASNNSSITVSVRHNERAGQREVVISMSNQGYGLPDSTLEKLLDRPASSLVGSEDLLEHTIGSLKNLAYWGARFEVESKLGEGFRFAIHLRAIGLDDKPSPAATPSTTGNG